MAFATTAPLRRAIETLLPERPFAIHFWDGTVVPPTRTGGPVLTARSPRAVSHVLRAPGQLGLGRAYVSGQLEVDDLDALNRLIWTWTPPSLTARRRIGLMLAAVRAAGATRPPSRPGVELRPRGARHSRARDARAVRHHYDVSNEFFSLFLDRSMTYSCAFFSRNGSSLESAQEAKLELTCRKLRLEPGQRVLDVGCGWGSFAIHAATCHGVSVLGITLSEQQAGLARTRVHEAGLHDRVTIRVQDYRDVRDDPFDAIASIGMVEHVGAERIDLYAERLAALVRPGGRLLNHGIAHLRHSDARVGSFTDRYVFPDADPLQLSRILLALERAGFVTEHVEEFGPDYAETLRHWIRRLDEHYEEAVRLAGEERVRVWRLYLRSACTGFETGFNSVYQVQSRLG
ncbi:MAG TPA: cyclopropane-fatty-acyl-phospholipid synthase family protein [Gemmatimonadales bacterium]|nr:cyclopropane-fatty-acyl-phospholipid synthase family protein [Gemmatimonadales bacterium]